MVTRLFKQFIALESAAGVLLFCAALLAIFVDNSPLTVAYQHLFAASFGFHLGPLSLEKPLLLWINDGLMVLFFLLVGLEMKREIYQGSLNGLKQISLPLILAIGGMVAPALVYIAFTKGNAHHMSGWAIPCATDIAFALAVLSLLGKRIPLALKSLLTAVAIFDDLGAIVVIALFYSANISGVLLLVSLGLVVVLWLLNRCNVTRRAPYFLVAFVLWLCVLKSGVHATLVGIVLAFAMPLTDKRHPERSPAIALEHALHPWIAYLVLPLFAFANAGVSFAGMSWSHVLAPVPMGIALGLVLGKQVGIFGAAWLCVKTRLAALPHRLKWRHIYGLSCVAGIGFTMSLFIGGLAFGFSDDTYGAYVRMGVIAGSLLSGLLGYLILRAGSRST